MRSKLGVSVHWLLICSSFFTTKSPYKAIIEWCQFDRITRGSVYVLSFRNKIEKNYIFKLWTCYLINVSIAKCISQIYQRWFHKDCFLIVSLWVVSEKKTACSLVSEGLDQIRRLLLLGKWQAEIITCDLLGHFRKRLVTRRVPELIRFVSCYRWARSKQR